MNKSDFFTIDGKKFYNKNNILSFEATYDNASDKGFGNTVKFNPVIIVKYVNGSVEHVVCGTTEIDEFHNLRNVTVAPYVRARNQALDIIKSIVE